MTKVQPRGDTYPAPVRPPRLARCRRGLRWLRLVLSRLAASDHMRELDAWERGYRSGFEACLRDREQR